MKGSFKLGSIAGIRIFIHWTFSILILYVIYSNYRAGHDAERIVWMVVFVLSIFSAVFLHELGHALAAKRYNIKTIDITILPIGGLARLETMPEKPIEELVVAIAGPVVNIALAIVASLFITLPNMEDLSVQVSAGVHSSNFILNFIIANVWLALFNLVPAFPMDGGRILRALLSMRTERHIATKIAARVGQVLAVSFVFAGFYISPFLIFIGLFIILGAQREASMAKASFILRELKVKEIVMRTYETISDSDDIETAVKKLLDGQANAFIVTSDGVPIGSLGRDEIIVALSNSGQQTSISSVVNRNPIRLDANQLLTEIYPVMLAARHSFAFVYDHQQFIGVLDLDNIFEYMMIKDAANNGSL